MSIKLHYPFKESRPFTTVKEGVWYIAPPQGVDNGQNNSPEEFPFIFPGWESPLFFGNNHPINIEYCSGNGEWIAKKALEEPGINWIAVEKKFQRASKIWNKKRVLGLDNLLIICGEGFSATKNYFPSNSIKNIFINFPDPWPKTRHHKHRIVQDCFVAELARILVPEGLFTFVTDDLPYGEWSCEKIQQSSFFSALYPETGFILEEESYGSSYFDALWRKLGRTIYYYRFGKKL